MLEMKGAVTDPIVEELQLIQNILSDELGTDLEKLREDLKTQKEDQAATKKAAGGRITGPGGPKEDKIPAYLSNGEYVVKASSAKRLGYGVLDISIGQLC